MHAQRLLHSYLQKSCPHVHKKRIDSLMRVAGSLLNRGKLTLTSLGRHLRGSSKVKHKVKLIDRLLGNKKLYAEQLAIYQAMAIKTIGSLTAIQVIVDWSPCASHAHQLLRASLVFKGRSITLYEEVHEEKDLANYRIHRRFLKRLHTIIPLACQVLIISDAGFRTDWFSLVLAQGWDFEGRVRGNLQYTDIKGNSWQACISLYAKATGRAKYIGNILLSKTQALPCFAYLYKEAPKVKKKKAPRKVKSGKMEKSYRKAAHDPWLLVTSVEHKPQQAKSMVKNYKRRMKIEHEFRDMKDPKWGLGLNYTRTRNVERLAILLLIGAIAIWLLWLIGLAAERKQLQYDYQANTIKTHRVLSLIFLALQVIEHECNTLCQQDLRDALFYAQDTEYRESNNG